MNPHIEEVIITEVERGSGTDKDAIRIVKQIWDKEGNLLGEYDEFAPVYLCHHSCTHAKVTTDCKHGCWQINPHSKVVFGYRKESDEDA